MLTSCRIPWQLHDNSMISSAYTIPPVNRLPICKPYPEMRKCVSHYLHRWRTEKKTERYPAWLHIKCRRCHQLQSSTSLHKFDGYTSIVVISQNSHKHFVVVIWGKAPRSRALLASSDTQNTLLPLDVKFRINSRKVNKVSTQPLYPFRNRIVNYHCVNSYQIIPKLHIQII